MNHFLIFLQIYFLGLKLNRSGLFYSKISSFPHFTLLEVSVGNDEGRSEGKWGIWDVGESAGL